MKIVVALGGNALGDTATEQLEIVKETANSIADLVAADHQVLVVHGNGPQVGMIDRQMSQAGVPFTEAVAMSQGYIGYHLQISLINELEKRGIDKTIVTLVTQVEVDKNDPAFKNPTKPIGKFYTKEEMEEVLKEHDYDMREYGDMGYRRVVPSPKPVDILEKENVDLVIGHGDVAIACGGGGIPVVKDSNGYSGIAAVIDKDFAASKLAQLVNADALFILTAVDYVAIDFGTPKQKNLKDISSDELKNLVKKDYFGVGSMLPKVEAVLEFVDYNNEDKTKIGVIASLDKIKDVLNFTTGTIVRK